MRAFKVITLPLAVIGGLLVLPVMLPVGLAKHIGEPSRSWKPYYSATAIVAAVGPHTVIVVQWYFDRAGIRFPTTRRHQRPASYDRPDDGDPFGKVTLPPARSRRRTHFPRSQHTSLRSSNGLLGNKNPDHTCDREPRHTLSREKELLIQGEARHAGPP